MILFVIFCLKMMNVRVLSFFAIVLRSSGVEVPDSPCPRIFDYFHSIVWLGRLSIPVPKSGLPVFTQVFLSIRTVLRNRYAGLIELNQPVEIAVDNIINFGANFINYTVRFPLPSPLPSLSMVKVNNVTICCSGEEHFGFVTTLILEHSFPTNPLYYSVNIDPRFTKKEPVYFEKCGQKRPTGYFESLKLPGFGEWPWLAAILLNHPSELEFHCTGTLLSEKHVITSAHCTRTRFGRQFPPRKFVVYFGKYDLSRWNEEDSQIRYVENIVVHPDYLKKFYASDLAIFVLEEALEINYFVRPVCLWKDGPGFLPLVGQFGAVAGWAKHPRKNLLSARPRIFHLPIVSQEDCLRSKLDYFYVTSENTFCAGLRNGSGPCSGYSGGGLVVPKTGANNRTLWYLRGITSLSLLDPHKQTCDLLNYLVFTDVAKYTNWIRKTISTTF